MITVAASDFQVKCIIMVKTYVHMTHNVCMYNITSEC